MTGNFRAPWGISLNPFLIVQSGRPFNITLGRDINGDTFNTERPALAPAGANCSDVLNFKCTPYGNFKLTFGPGDVMIPRNYAEGPGSTTVNLRVSKTWGFGSEGSASARNGRGRGNTDAGQQGNDGQRNSTMMGGGMAANGWLCQFLADILDCPVERPQNVETTALGAAFLAGLATGVWDSVEAVAATWQRRDLFTPAMDQGRRQQLIAGWREAVAKTVAGKVDAP